MEDPIRVYLHDHLAGSGFAIELLQKLAKEYPQHQTGIISQEILSEVRKDRETLEGIIERIGKSHTDLKDAAG